MVDASLTQIQVRCLWNLLRFLGREVTCREFTNAKAFLIGTVGTIASNFISRNELFLWMPRSIVHGSFWLFYGSTCLEMYGILMRVTNHYYFYFSNLYNGPRLASLSNARTCDNKEN